jgi:hypothetical protein
MIYGPCCVELEFFVVDGLGVPLVILLAQPPGVLPDRLTSTTSLSDSSDTKSH